LLLWKRGWVRERDLFLLAEARNEARREEGEEDSERCTEDEPREAPDLRALLCFFDFRHLKLVTHGHVRRRWTNMHVLLVAVLAVLHVHRLLVVHRTWRRGHRSRCVRMRVLWVVSLMLWLAVGDAHHRRTDAKWLLHEWRKRFVRNCDGGHWGADRLNAHHETSRHLHVLRNARRLRNLGLRR
jgi:hypothetical protein